MTSEYEKWRKLNLQKGFIDEEENSTFIFLNDFLYT